MSHSPLPWSVKWDLGALHIYSAPDPFTGVQFISRVSSQYFGGPPDPDADAQLIVTAVNAHADLLAALKDVVAALQKEAPGTPLNNHKYDALGARALAAIAKAEARHDQSPA